MAYKHAISWCFERMHDQTDKRRMKNLKEIYILMPPVVKQLHMLS